MINKRYSSFLIILTLLFCMGLSGCSNITSNKYLKNQNQFLFSIDNVNTSRDLFLHAWNAIKDDYLDKTYNGQDWNKWKTRYIDRIKTKDDAHVAIESMVESLNDPYTRFLPPFDFAEQNRSIDAKLFGIGVHIAKIRDKIFVIDVIKDTPAKQSGLKPGDIILKINGVSTKGLDSRDVADKVRGKANTKVGLEILRNKQKLEKSILRKEINIKSVEYKILKGNYAYIRISSFISSETSLEMLKALNATKNTRGTIIDLRGNQGGLLPNAIFIANMFVNKGTIVSIVDRNGYKQDIKAEPSILTSRKPVVILVNQASASASEVLSGALRDHGRAVLVGETTFGKGLVQKIQKLPDGSGINITIAKYLTPAGTDINKKGIKPDYRVKLTEKDFVHNKDPQLEKAEQILAVKTADNPAVASKS